MQYLLLCLVLFSFAASNAVAQGAEGTEIQITDNESDQYLPAIYGDRIIWTDDRYVNLPDNIENMTILDIFKLDTDIFIYNISTGEELYTLSESFKMNPAIYGDIVVWEDYSNASLPEDVENMTLEDLIQFNVDIYVVDLSSGQGGLVTEDSSWQGSPAIYGYRVVYQDLRNGNWDIYMYDLSTGEETQITTDEYNQMYPAIHGDSIVWQDSRNGNWDIYMYDLSTGEEVPIFTNESDQVSPDVYGDTVVWEDYGNANMPENVENMTLEDMSQINVDIRMYNLTSGEDMLVTSNPSWQGTPAIYGDRVVYQDLRNGSWDIYMTTLSSGEEFHITDNEYDQIYPAIYGDRIVWQDSRNGNWDIYMYDMSVGHETGTSTNTTNQVPSDNGTVIREDDQNVTISEDINNVEIDNPQNYDNNLSEGYEEIYNNTASNDDPLWTFLGGESTLFMMYEGDEFQARVISSEPVNIYVLDNHEFTNYILGYEFSYKPDVSVLNTKDETIRYTATYDGLIRIAVLPVNPDSETTVTLQVFQKKQDPNRLYDVLVILDQKLEFIKYWGERFND
jgi:beta propeller repeat protein